MSIWKTNTIMYLSAVQVTRIKSEYTEMCTGTTGGFHHKSSKGGGVSGCSPWYIESRIVQRRSWCDIPDSLLSLWYKSSSHDIYGDRVFGTYLQEEVDWVHINEGLSNVKKYLYQYDQLLPFYMVDLSNQMWLQCYPGRWTKNRKWMLSIFI